MGSNEKVSDFLLKATATVCVSDGERLIANAEMV